MSLSCLALSPIDMTHCKTILKNKHVKIYCIYKIGKFQFVLQSSKCLLTSHVDKQINLLYSHPLINVCDTKKRATSFPSIFILWKWPWNIIKVDTSDIIYGSA
jgi:hypothetical protein